MNPELTSYYWRGLRLQNTDHWYLWLLGRRDSPPDTELERHVQTLRDDAQWTAVPVEGAVDLHRPPQTSAERPAECADAHQAVPGAGQEESTVGTVSVTDSEVPPAEGCDAYGGFPGLVCECPAGNITIRRQTPRSTATATHVHRLSLVCFTCQPPISAVVGALDTTAKLPAIAWVPASRKKSSAILPRVQRCEQCGNGDSLSFWECLQPPCRKAYCEGCRTKAGFDRGIAARSLSGVERYNDRGMLLDGRPKSRGWGQMQLIAR